MGHVTRREPHIQSIKMGKISHLGKDLPFSDFFSIEREREGEKEEGFLWRFTRFRQSEFVESRTKIHHLDEGYA